MRSHVHGHMFWDMWLLAVGKIRARRRWLWLPTVGFTRRQWSRPSWPRRYGTAQPSSHLGWDSLTSQEERTMSLTSRKDQVAAVSLEKTFSGKTKLLKHHRDHPCLQDLELLDGCSGGCNQFWDVLALSKNYFFFIHVGVSTTVVTLAHGFSVFLLCQP